MSKLFKKIKGLGLKKFLSYGATFIVALFLGVGMGGSGMVLESDYNKLNSNYEKVSEELQTSQNTVKDLQSKVDDAKPFFDMKNAEREAIKIETEKQEEANKKEQAKLAEQKKKEDEAKKQAELDSRSVTLGNGTYLVGQDIPEGVYDLSAIKGGGNVQSSGQLNIIMGVSGDEDFYQREQQNVALKQGTNIELKGVTVKFVPDDAYFIKN